MMGNGYPSTQKVRNVHFESLSGAGEDEMDTESLQPSTGPSSPSPFEILISDSLLGSVTDSSVSSSSTLINATIALVLVVIVGTLNLIEFA